MAGRLLMLIVVCACTKAETKSESRAGSASASGSAASADSCRQRAEELGRTVAAIERGPTFAIEPGMKLVVRTDLPKREIPEAPLVTITRTELVLDGTVTTSPDALDVWLARRVAELAKLEAPGRLQPVGRAPRDRRLLLFAIDERASWGTVVPALASAQRAGFTAPAFVFATGTKRSAPPPSPADAELDRELGAQPGEAHHAIVLAGYLSKLIAGCPSLVKTFDQMTALAPREKAPALLAAVAPALIECDCAVDIPRLRTTLWRILAGDPVTILRTEIMAGDTSISLTTTTPWSDAQQRLVEGAKILPTVKR